MSDDDIQSQVTTVQLERDKAFCARMRAAVKAGLERAPVGIVTTPGTQNPKYVPTEPSPLSSSFGAMDV